MMLRLVFEILLTYTMVYKYIFSFRNIHLTIDLIAGFLKEIRITHKRDIENQEEFLTDRLTSTVMKRFTLILCKVRLNAIKIGYLRNVH